MLKVATVAKNGQICQKLSKAVKTWQKLPKDAKRLPKDGKICQKLWKTVNGAQLSNRRYVDTDMFPSGSYPHRKYMVCMLGNII